MPSDRFFSPSNFIVGSTVVLSDVEFHHMAHVMRAKEGQRFELVNGQGGLAVAEVGRMEKKQAFLIIKEIVEFPPENRNYTIVQALPRMSRIDTIIEKCTELGAFSIVFWASCQSERKEINDKQMQRLQSLAVSAMKQCGRLYLPKIIFLSSLEEFSFESFVMFGDTREQACSLAAVWDDFSRPKNAAIVIGPEKGLTRGEVEYLAHKGAKGVRLHKNILRTDTAPLAALTLMTALE